MYERLAAELQRLGLMTCVDGEMLASYCAEYLSYVEAVEMLRRVPAVRETTNANGAEYEAQSPWVNIRSKSLANMMALARRFGFSPADRVGLSAQDQDPGDPLSELISRAQSG